MLTSSQTETLKEAFEKLCVANIQGNKEETKTINAEMRGFMTDIDVTEENLKEIKKIQNDIWMKGAK